MEEKMRKLKNTLYVLTPNYYLGSANDNIVMYDKDSQEVGRIPIHNLESVISFGYRGVSPALMKLCADHHVSIIFLDAHGHFLSKIFPPVTGNVYLREIQYQKLQTSISLEIAKNCIIGKIYNSKGVIERFTRDHSMQVDLVKMKKVSSELTECIKRISTCKSKDSLRAIEGEAAKKYFSVFPEMILNKKDFKFNGRSKRPPMDRVNALLSLAYTLEASILTSALETVGLDPYIGAFHTERSGRPSLSFDLMEEFRSLICDRFVLSLINKRILNDKDFKTAENGAVLLTDAGKKKFFSEWQKKKTEVFTHPYLKEKVEWGLAPYVQATLLAKYFRDELDSYPVLLWK